MLNPPINQLLERAENRYSLVIAASKRARQLINGESPIIETSTYKEVSIATEEIYADEVTILKTEVNEG
jgi:DNA-directed RNA polymerase subunit omega